MQDSEKATVRRNTKKSSGIKRKGILNGVNTSITERISCKAQIYILWIFNILKTKIYTNFSPKEHHQM